MTIPETCRSRARIDLLEQFVYFGEQDSVEVAERYFSAVAETCALLAKQPNCGTLYDSGIARLQGMRRFPVRGFENYLIYYLSLSRGIDVIRVLHGARDIDKVFSTEERE